MRRKASTSFRGHPHSRLNLSPNPALRLFDILAGPPDFGSLTCIVFSDTHARGIRIP